MKVLRNLIRKWLHVKTAKNPSPDLESKIEQGRVVLKEQVSLLRLSNAELTKTSKELRFSVMQELIDDIARY
jgi:hypothetical protein